MSTRRGGQDNITLCGLRQIDGDDLYWLRYTRQADGSGPWRVGHSALTSRDAIIANQASMAIFQRRTCKIFRSAPSF